MRVFSQAGGIQASYEETRQISLLTQPIRSSGLLYFEPPDLLARRTTHPGDSKVVVRNGTVQFRDEAGTRTLNLSASPVARNLIENMIVVLRGDLVELNQRYKVTYSSEAEDWQLELVPRDSRVKSLVDSIRFLGTGKTLNTMETREANGDSSRSVFSDVRTGIEFSPIQHQTVFSIQEERKSESKNGGSLLEEADQQPLSEELPEE